MKALGSAAKEEKIIEGMEHEHHHHDADHDDDHDEDEHEIDEHVWLSLRNAATLVKAISAELAAVDPAHATTYGANADAYRGRLAALDRRYADAVAGAMAIGYLLMNLKPSSSNVSGDVCTTLFGSVSILTLTTADMWICTALSAGVVVCWLLSYHRLFDVTFDEGHAKACGTNTAVFNAVWAVVVAVVIVMSMRLVGTLLVTAILVFPAVAAMRVAKSFRAVTAVAAVFSVVCSLAGILVAVVAGTPVGSTIVGVDIAGFILLSAIGRSLP